MIGCSPDVMLHVTRKDKWQIQSAKADAASKPNVPRLLAKRLRSIGQVPSGVHEPWHWVMGQQMMSKRPEHWPEIAGPSVPCFAGTNPMALTGGQILQPVDQKYRASPTWRSVT